MSTPALSRIENIVGACGLRQGGDLTAFELDERKRYRGRALAVVLPKTSEQAVEVVRVCVQHAITIVPQGGNTGLVGAGVPDDSGGQVVLSTQRMNRVREVDALNMSLTVEAGCTLHDVQQAAQAADLLFPLTLASQGRCTIGGNLATNAGGTQVLRYGNTRELCLGLEVITPQGDLWNGLRALRKDNAGYALRELFIGSEGTLGLITAASLRLFPAVRAQACALIACDGLAGCVALLAAARARFDTRLTGLEAMNQASVALVLRHFPGQGAGWPDELARAPWLVLLELTDVAHEAALRDALQDFLLTHLDRANRAVLAHGTRQTHALWQMRECISSAQSLEGLNIKHDISLPLSRLADFVRDTDALVAKCCPGVRPITFGHLGDGNLHYNFQAPQQLDAAEFLERFESIINTLVFDQVQAHRGSIAAEHGIGQLRRDSLAVYTPPEGLALMRRLKTAWDPQGLFNPGRLL